MQMINSGFGNTGITGGGVPASLSSNFDWGGLLGALIKTGGEVVLAGNQPKTTVPVIAPAVPGSGAGVSSNLFSASGGGIIILIAAAFLLWKK